MAKGKFDAPAKAPEFPSLFGSHTSMIDQESTDKGTAELKYLDQDDNFVTQSYTLAEGEVFLKDENGLYVTQRNRLDNGMADPKRYASNRLFKQLKLEGKDDKKVEK